MARKELEYLESSLTTSLCYYVTVMRATFSIDDKTDAALRRVSQALGTSKSDVVRRAVLEFEARCDRLTERERREKLMILSRLRSEAMTRPDADVDRELQDLREAREAGWRDS